MNKRLITGTISSLPKIISNERINFSKSLKQEKLEAGPTSDRPGPRLVIQAIDAENDVIKS